MSEVDQFIHSVEYLVRDQPERADEFKADICRDLQTFLAYIEELESPIDRPEIKNRLEAQDDESFEEIINKYSGVVKDTDLGDLRRKVSAMRRAGMINELIVKLCSKPQEGVA